MIGSAISAAMGIGGAIFGGISASKAMKKVKRNLEQQKKENQDWYDRRYNEDATQRSDAQHLINRAEQTIKQRNKAAAGTAAVMGTSTEAVAAEKAANNAIIADTVSQIEAQASARKDAIEAQYRQRDSEIDGQLANLEAQKAGAVSQAIGGMASAAGSFGTGLDDFLSTRKKA